MENPGMASYMALCAGRVVQLTAADAGRLAEISQTMMQEWDTRFPEGPSTEAKIVDAVDEYEVMPTAHFPRTADRDVFDQVVKAIAADPRGIWRRRGFGSVYFDLTHTNSETGEEAHIRINLSLAPIPEGQEEPILFNLHAMGL